MESLTVVNPHDPVPPGEEDNEDNSNDDDSGKKAELENVKADVQEKIGENIKGICLF